jgi:hypothetical protein
MEISVIFDDFTVQHASRDENIVANDLVQQASNFDRFEKILIF